jgi:chorismate-pyruvate lyase
MKESERMHSTPRKPGTNRGMSELPASKAAAGPTVNLFYPMNEFYERSGAPLPRVVQVQGCDVPEPYRSLLVHDRDMTPTLTNAYQREMKLRILKKVINQWVFAREIILEVEGSATVAVFAAIKIYLNLFNPEPKRIILEGKQPFGRILHEHGIIHSSRPQAFIQVNSDETINHALRLTGHHVLYGRRSALLNSSQVPLAQVLEILPPSQP